MRWMLIGSTGIYALPIIVYLLLFGNLHILCEIIIGSFSFLYFGPTYLQILNIYSLCRIDDISWGTKGLDSGSSRNNNLKDSWRLIKFVHVSKFVVWNIILGVVLLTLGSSYTPRFFVTIVMVALIGLSLSLKVFVGILYMIAYKLKGCCSDTKEFVPTNRSRIGSVIEGYQGQIME